MRHNLTTPGGFFVGLGGIVAFCVMSSVIYWWVKSSGANSELLPQQQALGLAAKKEDAGAAAAETKARTDALLAQAAKTYQPDGKKPNLDNLAELRGVVRYRAAQEADKKAAEALNAPSVVAGKTIIQASMEAVADEIKKKPVTKSAVALMEITAADPTAAPSLPNVTGGGAKTMQFADPSKPAAAPAPAAPAPGGTPAPAKPAAAPAASAPAAAPVPAPAVPAAPAPARPPLINSSEPQK